MNRYLEMSAFASISLSVSVEDGCVMPSFLDFLASILAFLDLKDIVLAFFIFSSYF